MTPTELFSKPGTWEDLLQFTWVVALAHFITKLVVTFAMVVVKAAWLVVSSLGV